MPSSTMEKMGALMFRAMDKMRHRDAFDIGSPTGTDFTGFDKSRYAHAERAIAANWSPAMRIFERGLDKGSAAAGIPIAYIEISPASQPR